MWLLLACSVDAPEPALARTPQPPVPPKEISYTLTGRATPQGIDFFPLPEAQPLVENSCQGLKAKLKANKTTGCLVERWSPDPENPDQNARYLLRSGLKLRFASNLSAEGKDLRPAEVSWHSIDPVLSHCLGDLWALPPAGDPKGTRTMQGDTWIFRFSGDNPCGLQGSLKLGVFEDHASATELLTDNTLWSRGGKEQTKATIWEALLKEIPKKWPELSREERLGIITLLSESEKPEAALLLQQLQEKGKKK
jgi:hypothetical protein